MWLNFLSVASAKPNCNVPKPPPICEGGDPRPPPPKPQPTPPPPSMSLQRPGITGSGYFLDTEFNVLVRPQAADKSNVSRMVVEKGSTDNGPWSAWVDRPVPPSGSGNFGPQYPFYSSSLKYVVVLPRTCFRARFFTARGGYSPWSAAKCAASAFRASPRFAPCSSAARATCSTMIFDPADVRPQNVRSLEHES